MTASSRSNSNTDLNEIDETRGSFAVKGVELLFNKRNFDRQAQTHHRLGWWNFNILVAKAFVDETFVPKS